MAIFAEAKARLYNRIFVCQDCKQKIRAQILKVQAGRVSCRRCKSKSLRTVKQK